MSEASVQAAGGRARLLRVSSGLLIAAYCGSVLWLAFPTLRRLYDSSFSFYSYNDGSHFALISVWLAFEAWRRGAIGRPFVPSPMGLAALIGVSIGLVVSTAVQVELGAQLLLPPLFLSAFWAVGGSRNARGALAPAAFLYFAAPVWEILRDPLRALTTNAASAVVHSMGIPAHIQGNFIHIASGTFEVADGCSGLNFFLVSLALSSLYGLLTYERWRSRLALIAVAIGLALFANWVRVIVLVVLGHHSEMQHTLIVDGHYAFGWILFAVAMALMFVVAYMLERDTPAIGQQAAGAEAVRPAHGRQRHEIVISIAALVAVLAGATMVNRLGSLAGADPAAQAIGVPSIGQWRNEGAWSGRSRPQFVSAASEAAAIVGTPEGRLGVYLAHYPAQGQGREVVNYSNRAQGEEARVLEEHERTVASGDEQLTFRELLVTEARGEQRLVWFGMQVAGRQTASDYLAKIYQALGAVTGRGDAQALVLSADCTDDCAMARQRLARYAREAAPTLFGCAAAASWAEDRVRTTRRTEPCNGS